jgi:phosphoglucosamine mutase
MLEAAVVAGLASTGVDVLRVGVLPTPAVAFLTANLAADVGVMLSASHNPMPDNGIKLFARGGHKLPDEVENAIEADLARVQHQPRPTGSGVAGSAMSPTAPPLSRPPARLRGHAAARAALVVCANRRRPLWHRSSLRQR